MEAYLIGSTGWEDAAKTICTTNAPWKYIQQICQNLCDYFCDEVHFLSPEKVLRGRIKFLKNKIKLGYRSEYVFSLAESIVPGKINLDLLEFGACEKQYAEKKVQNIKRLDSF